MDIKKLSASLVQAEGCVLKMYKDTLGYDTIGVGHKVLPLEKESFVDGINMNQAMDLLNQDIQKFLPKLSDEFDFFDDLDDVRKRVIAEMCFNMGIEGVKKFHQTLDDISNGYYDAAATQMLNSLWAKQVKGRAVRLANMMRTGEDPQT